MKTSAPDLSFLSLRPVLRRYHWRQYNATRWPRLGSSPHTWTRPSAPEVFRAQTRTSLRRKIAEYMRVLPTYSAFCTETVVHLLHYKTDTWWVQVFPGPLRRPLAGRTDREYIRPANHTYWSSERRWRTVAEEIGRRRRGRSRGTREGRWSPLLSPWPWPGRRRRIWRLASPTAPRFQTPAEANDAKRYDEECFQSVLKTITDD